MKTISMEILKRNPLGNMERRCVDISGLNEVLTPEEIFMMEFKINEIPSIRAHISVNDVPSFTPDSHFCRNVKDCTEKGKCQSIVKYDRACND